MGDKGNHQDRLKGILHSETKAAPPLATKLDADDVEASCAAFGYLRDCGILRLPWSFV